MPHEINAAMRECIDECQDCHAVCIETAAHCLMLGGKHASFEHQTLLQDCAQICQTSADYMLRGSTLHRETCRACAAICDRCADACEGMGDDSAMKRCAEACRSCAESCRQMAGTAA
jgi:hypothetical protein